jgi:MraZ protein
MFGRAVDVEVDSIGRILIPDFLKEMIKPSNKVAVIGMGDRVEVWNDKVWLQYYKDTAEGRANELAEKLGNQK